jgi:hypothetical protein
MGIVCERDIGQRQREKGGKMYGDKMRERRRERVRVGEIE